MKLLDHWLPGDDFGSALACFATSFTFDSDFFTDDCLSRFLSITTRDPDGAVGLDIAGMLEEEERLAEATVCVLVDQSCRPQPRNLRWDLLPVRVPHGLLHAKVAILLWERACRVIIGSANLTTAGYRHQVEIGLAIDVDQHCSVPRSVLSELSAELRDLLPLVPGDAGRPGPKQRALSVLDLFDDRLATLSLPTSPPPGMKMALAAARLGTNPLDKLDQVWSGPKPQSVTALSPFWDDTDSMSGAASVVEKLAERASGGEATSATFVVPVDDSAGARIVRAPAKLRSVAPARIASQVVAFGANDDRRLHAKCVQYESSQWLATMFGSSNVTAKGLGIDAAPHREINLWIGCKAGTPQAKALSGLIACGDEVGAEFEWVVAKDDEDDTVLDPLPLGFGEALLLSRTAVELAMTGRELPERWSVEIPRPGQPPLVVLDSAGWFAAGRPARIEVNLDGSLDHLPSLLDVRWSDGFEQRSAVWFVNVGDAAVLPPPAELRELPAEVLLAILASTRPLRSAVEEAMRSAQRAHHSIDDELDPLKRFDSSGFLLQRTRRASAALWGVERRLSQPLHSAEALEWRIGGTLGPEHLAQKLAEAGSAERALPGEAEFLLAELALTVHRVPWERIAVSVPLEHVEERVRHALEAIGAQLATLTSSATDPSVKDYVDAVMAEVTR